MDGAGGGLLPQGRRLRQGPLLQRGPVESPAQARSQFQPRFAQRISWVWTLFALREHIIPSFQELSEEIKFPKTVSYSDDIILALKADTINRAFNHFDGHENLSGLMLSQKAGKKLYIHCHS